MPWELNGNSGTNNSSFLGTQDSQPLAIRTNANVDATDRVVVGVSGNVGIGTSTPASKVEIHAQDGLQIVGFQPFLTLTDSHGGSKRVRIQDANGDLVCFTESGLSSGLPALVIKNGTNTVQINGQDGLQIVGFQPFLTLSDGNSGFKRVRIQDANGDLVCFTESGLSSGLPAMVIKDGSGDVNITNGSLRVAVDVVLAGGDCAEHFDVVDGGGCDAGTVMVINDDGSLEPSTVAYDKRVAGVVSGAGALRPGIILDKQACDDGRLPIALVGKVYCKVDAQSGPISVGDLLTTSDSPGFAMKAREPSRAFGAVIGKALRPLSAGRALIPILVALQ